jgi:hypothetical protein
MSSIKIISGTNKRTKRSRQPEGNLGSTAKTVLFRYGFITLDPACHLKRVLFESPVTASEAWQSQYSQFVLLAPTQKNEKVTVRLGGLENVLPFTKQNKLVRMRTQTEFCLPLRYPPLADARFTNPFSLTTSYL